MEKLEIELTCFLDDEGLAKNLDINLKRNVPTVKEGMFKDRVASICGSGPSIAATLTDLTGDIWACNGAYDWLLKQGIIPDYFFGWDPSTELLDYLHNAHENTTFVLASTCAPEIFEQLSGHKVLMWHADTGGSNVIHDAIVRHNRREDFYVGGGSACLTRAPYLLYTLGYKEVHLHGADSSIADDGNGHIAASGGIGPGLHKVWCLGKEFLISLWMGAQSQQFLPMTERLKDMRIKVHGDGLIPHIARMNGFHYNNVV